MRGSSRLYVSNFFEMFLHFLSWVPLLSDFVHANLHHRWSWNCSKLQKLISAAVGTIGTVLFYGTATMNFGSTLVGKPLKEAKTLRSWLVLPTLRVLSLHSSLLPSAIWLSLNMGENSGWFVKFTFLWFLDESSLYSRTLLQPSRIAILTNCYKNELTFHSCWIYLG